MPLPRREPQTVNMILHKKKLTLAALLSLFALLASMIVSFLASRIEEEKHFHEKYSQLAIGLSKGEVEDIWGAPEYSIRVVGGKELWSYKDEGHPIHVVRKITFADKTNPSRGKGPQIDQIVSIEKLGDFSAYSNAELLFDEKGLLEAYTKIGEESAVHTKYGDISGSGWTVYHSFLNRRKS